MNKKFNKNSKVEQLTQICLSSEEEKGLIVKDPLLVHMGKFTLSWFFCHVTAHLHTYANSIVPFNCHTKLFLLNCVNFI